MLGRVHFHFDRSLRMAALLFWGIFLFWQAFPLFVAGFGATFEFRTLLRFPLSLTAFYLVGLAYGLADFAAIASICWLLAIAVGAGFANPALLPPVFVILVLFILMCTTFERLLGSWLDRLLARRRTRELFFGLFILLSVSVQFIRPLITRYANGSSPASVLRFLPYLVAFSAFACQSRARGCRSAVEGAAFLLNVAGLLAYVGIFQRITVAPIRGAISRRRIE